MAHDPRRILAPRQSAVGVEVCSADCSGGDSDYGIIWMLDFGGWDVLDGHVKRLALPDDGFHRFGR